MARLEQGIIFLYGKGNKNHQLGTGFFVHYRILSAVKRVEFVSDRMSYIVLRGCWCKIVLNVHAPSEEKSDDSTHSFYDVIRAGFRSFLYIPYENSARRF